MQLDHKKVLVCGGRDYADEKRVYEVLDELHGTIWFTTLVHGGATGADKLASEWAKSRGVREAAYPVTNEEWIRIGKSAGPLRNRRMFESELPRYVFAFPGNRGTKDMAEYAKKRGAQVVMVSA